jgi:hypothetical protein
MAADETERTDGSMTSGRSCLRCGGPVVWPRGLGRVLDGNHLVCVRCGWSWTPAEIATGMRSLDHAAGSVVPPGPWWWLLLGALFTVATGALAMAIWTGGDSVCGGVPIRGDCPAALSRATWFRSGEAGSVSALAAVLAGIVIPFGIGYVARRWLWLAVCPVALIAAVWIGYDLGDWAARHSYPDHYWRDPWRGLLPVAVLALGLPLSSVCTAVGVVIGERRHRGAVARRRPADCPVLVA